jgi:Ferritin-like
VNAPPPSSEALDELDRLATVEHALIIEYLTISYALSPTPTSPDTGETAQRVNAAADAARRLSLREMHHLHQMNRFLTRAGRPAQVGRATSVGPAGSEIALGPPTAEQLEVLAQRERAIAAAVDASYARICDALTAVDSFFICPDHGQSVAELLSGLEGIPPSEFLRVTRRVPSDNVERTLLEVSDQHYRLIVATLGASFAHEDELGDELVNRSMTTMDVLDAINQLLLSRGLLPAFTLA